MNMNKRMVLTARNGSGPVITAVVKPGMEDMGQEWFSGYAKKMLGDHFSISAVYSDGDIETVRGIYVIRGGKVVSDYRREL